MPRHQKHYCAKSIHDDSSHLQTRTTTTLDAEGSTASAGNTTTETTTMDMDATTTLNRFNNPYADFANVYYDHSLLFMVGNIVIFTVESCPVYK